MALIREIDHHLGRPAADIGALFDRRQDRTTPTTPISPLPYTPKCMSGSSPKQGWERFEREHARTMLMALVPARSDDPHRYRTAIASAARAVFEPLLDGRVTQADWNAILKAASPSGATSPAWPARAWISGLAPPAGMCSPCSAHLSRDRLAP